MKQCSTCGITKQLKDFALKRGGRAARCKQCCRSLWKEYYAANRDLIIKKTKQWKLDHREYWKTYKREWARKAASQ